MKPKTIEICKSIWQTEPGTRPKEDQKWSLGNK